MSVPRNTVENRPRGTGTPRFRTFRTVPGIHGRKSGDLSHSGARLGLRTIAASSEEENKNQSWEMGHHGERVLDPRCRGKAGDMGL